jgi:hypothetical protein
MTWQGPMTTREAADRTGIKPGSVREAVRRGTPGRRYDFKGRLFCGQWRVWYRALPDPALVMLEEYMDHIEDHCSVPRLSDFARSTGRTPDQVAWAFQVLEERGHLLNTGGVWHVMKDAQGVDVTPVLTWERSK